METDSSLVRSYRAAALDAESSVYTYFSFIVKPRHSEDDDPLRFHDSLKNLEVHQIRMFGNVRRNALKHFLDSLMKFLFSRVSGDEISHETINIILCKLVHNRIYLLGVNE